MGIKRGTAEKIDNLIGLVGKTISERGIERTDALADLTDEQLRDLDSVLQIAYFVRYRQEAAGRAERTIGEVVDIIERTAADIEGAEHRSEDALERAEAAVRRISEAHRRAMPHLDAGQAHKWFKQFNKY